MPYGEITIAYFQNDKKEIHSGWIVDCKYLNIIEYGIYNY